MEMIGAFITMLSFAISVVVGGVCLVRGFIFTIKARSNMNKDIASHNDFTSMNSYNVLWVPNALTNTGREYRLKAIKNICIFFGLLGITFLLNYLTGFSDVST